jgi:hypothetical protein
MARNECTQQFFFFACSFCRDTCFCDVINMISEVALIHRVPHLSSNCNELNEIVAPYCKDTTAGSFLSWPCGLQTCNIVASDDKLVGNTYRRSLSLLCGNWWNSYIRHGSVYSACLVTVLVVFRRGRTTTYTGIFMEEHVNDSEM